MNSNIIFPANLGGTPEDTPTNMQISDLNKNQMVLDSYRGIDFASGLPQTQNQAQSRGLPTSGKLSFRQKDINLGRKFSNRS